MMKFTLLTLFTVYSISQCQDADGPGCYANPDVNLCSSDPNLTVANKLECGGSFSCCNCASIVCNDCQTAAFGGDNAAYGVHSITLNGNSDGLLIKANEDFSLADGVDLIASNVVSAEFSGDNALRNSMATLTCLATDNGCNVKCDGDSSCNGSTIIATNVKSFYCMGDDSCANSDILINNPGEHFKLECGDTGCTGAEITIKISTCRDIEAIQCKHEMGCMSAKITVINECGSVINIKDFGCRGEDACDYAEFRFEGDINIENCICDKDACDGAGVAGGTGVTCIDGTLESPARSEGNKLLGNDNEENNVNVIVSLSDQALENIWAMVIVIIVINVIIFALWYCKNKKKRGFGDV